MIIKEIKSKKSTRSLNNLVSYMLDTQNDGSKVDYISISNCINDDIDFALIEMNLIQGMNNRTKLDKTMHFVISFPENEVPNREQMNDIEQNIADSIGLGKHHRISVAHSNTENYHLHMAISRIDPENQKMINPYNYFKHAAKVRDELEIKHDLQMDYRREYKEPNNYSMDHHSGKQSLHSWCQDNLKPQLTELLPNLNSWEQLHSFFNESGLELKQSGRGLVILNNDNGAAIKASSISRDFSYTKLQRNIGEFKPSANKKKTQSKQLKKTNKDPLFTKYEEFKGERTQKKESSLDSLRLDAFQQREIAKAENVYRRSKIKENTILTSTQKFNSYQRLAAKNKAVSSVITTEYAKARKSIYNQYGNMTFQQYLCYEAANGNEEALKRLRAKANHQITRNGLSGDKDKRVTQFDNINVDKQGILHYQVGSNTILDNGKQLTTKSEGLQAHKQLLEMAIIKYGNNLTINGSNEFKEQIKQSAEMLNLNIKLNGEHIQSHDPVNQFIDKRNQDKEKINTILEHQLYKDEQGKFEYDGYRNIGNQSVVLLKKDNVLFVKPIEKKMLSHYKSMKKGASITIGSTSPDKANQLER